VATIDVPATGGMGAWQVVAAQTASIAGVHDLYFVLNAKGRHIPFGVDWWQFEH
jgi:hypothetical protein